MSSVTSRSPCWEPGVIVVTPRPKQIEHANPGGVNWTMR
jgi:hypothetical protein